MTRGGSVRAAWVAVCLCASACEGSGADDGAGSTGAAAGSGGSAGSGGAAGAGGTAAVTLTLLQTSDIHANLFDWDYGSGTDDPTRGLVRVASLVRAERQKNPCTLLIDTGDTIQGAALGVYYARNPGTAPHPIAVALNFLAYDAMALGNHEFNLGLENLTRFSKDVSFPVLAANVVDGTGAHPYLASTTKEVCGVRVGIVGIVTTSKTAWMPSVSAAGYGVEDQVSAAAKAVADLKSKGVDLVVIAAHSGPGRSPSGDLEDPKSWLSDWQTWTGGKSESAAVAIAEAVPGIDVLLTGHTHLRIPMAFVNGAIMVQPGFWARHLGKVQVAFEKDSTGAWKVASKQSELLAADGATRDPQFVTALGPANQKVIDYLDEPIATTSLAFPGGLAAQVTDGPLLGVVNRAQLAAAAAAGFPADVSVAQVFSDFSLSAGTVRRRDAFGLYGFDNVLGVVEVDGTQLTSLLEHSASYFQTLNPALLPTDASGVLAGKLIYYYDVADGVEYSVDLTKPPGQRITTLRFKGVDVQPTQKFRVVANSFRLQGGNGYPVYSSVPVLWWSDTFVHEEITKYLSSATSIDPASVVTCDYQVTPDLHAQYLSSLGAPVCP